MHLDFGGLGFRGTVVKRGGTWAKQEGSHGARLSWRCGADAVAFSVQVRALWGVAHGRKGHSTPDCMELVCKHSLVPPKATFILLEVPRHPGHAYKRLVSDRIHGEIFDCSTNLISLA